MSNKKDLSILLVDDDKFLLDMYAIKFKSAGYTVHTSSGAQDALNKLRGGDAPNILVFDIIMPQMDGLELLENVKKEGLAKDSVIVMLTNETEPAKIEKAKSLGIDGYIVKATLIPSEVVEEVIKIAENKK